MTQNAIALAEAFCHCSVNCIQSWKGFIAAMLRASALGQLLAGPKLDKDSSFDSIADGKPLPARCLDLLLPGIHDLIHLLHLHSGHALQLCTVGRHISADFKADADLANAAIAIWRVTVCCHEFDEIGAIVLRTQIMMRFLPRHASHHMTRNAKAPPATMADPPAIGAETTKSHCRCFSVTVTYFHSSLRVQYDCKSCGYLQ